MRTIGLDIGGANLKAADNDGRAVSRAFALWREPERLVDELMLLLNELGCPPVDRMAFRCSSESVTIRVFYRTDRGWSKWISGGYARGIHYLLLVGHLRHGPL